MEFTMHRPRTTWERRKDQIRAIWDVYRETKVGIIGIIILIFFAAMAFASYIPPAIDEMYRPLSGCDPDVIGFTQPSSTHILGTDFVGRDIFSQLLEGTKWALIIGCSAAVCSVVLSTVVGLVSGYYGGVIDSLLQRTAETVMALPGFAVVVVVGSILRGIGIWNIVVLISLFSWPYPSKVIRAWVLSLRERPFIESARVSGASNMRIIFRHIGPNVLPLTFLYLAFGVTGAILTEATLSFLGMGDPHIVSWGMMLQWCFRTGHTYNAPFWVIPPGLCIALLSLSFYLIGVGTEQIINPKLRKR